MDEGKLEERVLIELAVRATEITKAFIKSEAKLTESLDGLALEVNNNAGGNDEDEDDEDEKGSDNNLSSPSKNDIATEVA